MSGDTEAYLRRLAAFYDDPDCMAKEPPRPPTFEVAMDVASACAKAMGTLLDRMENGGPVTSVEPSMKSKLKVAEILDSLGTLTPEQIAAKYLSGDK